MAKEILIKDLVPILQEYTVVFIKDITNNKTLEKLTVRRLHVSKYYNTEVKRLRFGMTGIYIEIVID